MVEAFPLHWPDGWKRTPAAKRARSNFKTTLTRAYASLQREIRLLGGDKLVISTNVPVRKDGDMYAGNWNPDDVGVAVYFQYKGKPMCFACDKYNVVRDNLRAIAMTIEALRGIERWGASDMLERAFTGFQALPERAETPWREMFGVPAGQIVSAETIQAKFRELSKKYHPDLGGSHESFATLTRARDRALQEIGSHLLG